jgi:hypothetical protein
MVQSSSAFPNNITSSSEEKEAKSVIGKTLENPSLNALVCTWMPCPRMAFKTSRIYSSTLSNVTLILRPSGYETSVSRKNLLFSLNTYP